MSRSRRRKQNQKARRDYNAQRQQQPRPVKQNYPAQPKHKGKLFGFTSKRVNSQQIFVVAADVLGEGRYFTAESLEQRALADSDQQ